MLEENQTYTVNGDGSLSIKGEDGKTVKYVKESDLVAVKVQVKDKEGEVSSLQASLATATAKYDTSHQDVLKERAAREQFEKDAKDAVVFKDKVTELETELAGLKTSSGEMATKLTEQLRNQLKTTFKIADDKLEGKALPDLENMASVLQLAGFVPGAANYDGAGGNGGGPSNLEGKNPLALAEMGYAKDNK